MIDISALLSSELNLKPWQVSNTLDLLAEGGTIPFIARYRKERTGELDEVVLRTLKDRYDYLTELEERKQTVLASIREQGKLTADLERSITDCISKTALEDLYLPYKPKRRTRATIARERGLEPLAVSILEFNVDHSPAVDLTTLAMPFVNPALDVHTTADALKGASDILAEDLAERAELRQTVRSMLLREAEIVSKRHPDAPSGETKFDLYLDYRCPITSIPAHAMLALRRGESENVLSLTIECDEAAVLHYLRSKFIATTDATLLPWLSGVVKDAYDRLMRVSLITDVRLEKKKEADAVSIATFGSNLKELLLAPPAGMKPTLGIDPGFRTGCKFAVVDATARFIEHATVYPTAGSTDQRQKAGMVLRDLIRRHGIELIAIGNGTASRETEQFVNDALKELSTDQPRPVHVLVSEAGASVYSASEVAGEEFPDLDLTIRGAISIARRLQDPLSELVKIDPKSIGVGQYQHDVDQRQLKQKLEETVESCVNFVGVDVNLASKELLSFVAGLTPSLAKAIIDYRNSHGPFQSRKDLLNVPRFGPKAFEQAAGFLRIRNGANPLDNSSVHPERYHLVERIASDLGVELDAVTRIPDRIRSVDIKRYVNDTVGEPTLRDVLAELEKPGRDPRATFRYATFKEGVNDLKDLSVGMELEGVVTNVADFGAFVDIGVHQDGLVHVSQLANRFVKDPKDVVKVGQVVKVRVLDVNIGLKRISLTMKLDSSHGGQAQTGRSTRSSKQEQPSFTLNDLQSKFRR